METRKLPTPSYPPPHPNGPGRTRSRSRILIITVIDTLAWFVATAALATAIGNSALLQIASALVFTLLWFVAVRRSSLRT